MESSDTSPATAAPAGGKKKEGLWETLRFLLILFVLALLFRSLVAAPFSIPSGSMLPRMMIGDFLLVAKWPYGFSRYSFPFGFLGFEGRILEREAERGDVAIFRYPGPGNDDYVKRIIGLPGDTVQMQDGTLLLNGEPVQRTRIADFLVPLSPNSPCRALDPDHVREVADGEGRLHCAYPRYRETLPGGRSYEIIDQTEGPGDDTPLFTVPDGHYFVMGDNRDDSLDSRFPTELNGVGFLPSDHLVGRAMITFFSTDGSAEWLKPWTWVSAARWERIGQTY